MKTLFLVSALALVSSSALAQQQPVPGIRVLEQYSATEAQKVWSTRTLKDQIKVTRDFRGVVRMTELTRELSREDVLDAEYPYDCAFIKQVLDHCVQIAGTLDCAKVESVERSCIDRR